MRGFPRATRILTGKSKHSPRSGVEKSRIFCDKKSGRDFDRSGYKRMFARLRRGDLLVIKSIGRLGRNMK